jgi:hypothetical protein
LLRRPTRGIETGNNGKKMNNGGRQMNTVFLLMAQYGATAVVPIDVVCRDYFAPMTVATLLRKIGAGEIKLPLIRMESSQKCAKGVHIQDLANYIDERRAVALKECKQLCG